MTLVEIIATTIAAGIGLVAVYRLIMWLADRAIRAIEEMFRFE